MRPIALALGLLLLSQIASAATLHVPADYPTIQQAINAATSGDIVLVAAGTYHESITLGPASDGVKVNSESGAAATTIIADTNVPTVTVNGVGSGTELVGFTITHGLGQSNGIAIGATTAASPKIDSDVMTGNTAGRGAGVYVVRGGPSITHCVLDANTFVPDPFGDIPGNGGAGIYVEPVASATITDDTITNNNGQGIYVVAPTYVDIENNLIQGNHGVGVFWDGNNFGIVTPGVIKNNRFISNVGPAVSVYGLASVPTPTLPVQGNLMQSNQSGGINFQDATGASAEDNKILGNTNGSGIYLYGGTYSVRGNLIQDNSEGGINMWHAQATIEQNLILRNHRTAPGGGLASRVSTATLKSNTIALNGADQGGGNLYFREGSVLTLQNNILSHSANQGVWQDNSGGGNTITMSCNDVSNNAGGNYLGMPDPTGTNGNVSLDPLYCSLPTLDVHLASTSPCAAANSPAGCGLVGALDIGCDGPVRTEPTTWGAMKARYR